MWTRTNKQCRVAGVPEPQVNWWREHALLDGSYENSGPYKESSKNMDGCGGLTMTTDVDVWVCEGNSIFCHRC